MAYNLRWSDKAVSDLEDILSYLSNSWAVDTVNKFKKQLSRQLDLITQYPLMFPKSDHNPELRKSVLSKQTSIFYKIEDTTVFIVHLFVNSQNIEKLKF